MTLRYSCYTVCRPLWISISSIWNFLPSPADGDGPALHDFSPGPAMTLLPVDGEASKRTSSLHVPASAVLSVWSGLGGGISSSEREVATD